MVSLHAANIALNKQTWQSTTAGDYNASHAIDLEASGVLAASTCAQTAAGADQWWAVDLQHVYVIANVKIYNRADCCGKYSFSELLHVYKSNMSYTEKS